MSKTKLVAKRDIKKGEIMDNVIAWEDGNFHFFDKTGTAWKVPHARQAFSPEERAARDRMEAVERLAVEKRKAERRLARDERLRATREAAAARKAERQAKLSVKIAALQEKKAKL